MPLTEAQKAYRATPEEREKRRLYAQAHRRRPEVMAADRLRAQKRRAAPDGAETNRQRVKANRAALGRNYLAELLASESGTPGRHMPENLVDIKREQITLRRLAATMQAAANQAKEQA